ncbi:helix-turn-helix transcriptional regulator [Citreimonas salinaria]|uniref:Regulatory protein, luxR family n=1 Tax=Citreimonas salinaria TaxID=321339 RepID=A0A1H3NQL3_9RHOB|nr:LuxR C-terminal-related transcriptional regulator [Citreimonas salinaria]SDY90735.1 regulatory protein, luxR family [Citreimonas salinaria]
MKFTRSSLVAVLLAVQFLCAVFVFYDLTVSSLGLRSQPIAWALYEAIEVASALGLALGAVLSAWVLHASMRARNLAEDRLRLAKGAFFEVIQEQFTAWGLTPAERDVAMMAVKGFSTAEIARIRGTSEGTTKAQTAAVYRKAGVKSRSQLLGLFVEDLLEDGLEGTWKNDAPAGNDGSVPGDETPSSVSFSTTALRRR